jgi:hypothetical protein
MPDEKVEEKEEKELEKREEKSWEEKWRRDPLTAVIWALVFIWAGLVLLADNLNLLDQLGFFQFQEIPGFEVISAWPLILVGAGLLFLLEAVIRLLVPAYRKSVTGTLIFGLVLIGLGLNDIVEWNWTLFGALVLIIVGVSILIRGFTRNR